MNAPVAEVMADSADRARDSEGEAIEAERNLM